MTEYSAEAVRAVAGLLDEHARRHEDMEAGAYDGANGLPPDWIPEATTWRFRQTRDYFLDGCGYTPAALSQLVGSYPDKGAPTHRTHPNGGPVDRANLNLLLGFLANLHWVVSLGCDKGMTELANIDAANAAFGERMREGPKGPRVDALKSCLIEAYEELKQNRKDNPQNSDVLKHLEGGRFADTIQEIDWELEEIYWVTRQGVDKSTSFPAFFNRMTDVRKEYLA